MINLNGNEIRLVHGGGDNNGFITIGCGIFMAMWGVYRLAKPLSETIWHNSYTQVGNQLIQDSHESTHFNYCYAVACTVMGLGGIGLGIWIVSK